MRLSHRKAVLLALCLTASHLQATEPKPQANHHEVPLPARAIARIGDHRFYHGPGITCAVLSPDGRRAASAAKYSSHFHVSEKEREQYERTIVLWDTATGQRLHELKTANGPVARLAFSPDGKRLAAACEATVTLFAVESGKPVTGTWNLKHRVAHLQFSADGEQLWICDSSKTATSWHVPSAKPLVSLTPSNIPDTWVLPDAIVDDVVPSPDGKHLAWLSSVPLEQPKEGNFFAFGTRPTRLVITDSTKGRPLHRKEFIEGLDKLAFSRNGRRFAILDAGELSVFDMVSGKQVLSLNVAPSIQCALSPDGRKAITEDRNGSARLWDLNTRKPIHEISFGLDCIYSAFSQGQGSQVFSDDGKTLLLINYSTLRLFNATTGKECDTPRHRSDEIIPRFSADGQTLYTTCQELRRTWTDLEQKTPRAKTANRRNGWEKWKGLDRDTSADGHYFLSKPGTGEPVQIGESATGRVVGKFENSESVYFGRVSPDDAKVLLWELLEDGKEQSFLLFDSHTGKKTGEFKPDDRAGYPMFSNDSRLVALAERSHNVRLHDAVTGRLTHTLRSLRPLPRAECNLTYLLFSPDNELLIVANHLGSMGVPYALPARVFHIASGQEIQRFYLNPESTEQAGLVSAAACSPDNRLVAVAEEGSGTIRLIEIATGKVRADFKGHRHGVHALAFSPDGRTLASGGKDNVVFLWDVSGAQTAPAPKEIGGQQLKQWWTDLASEDAQLAGAALASLVRSPAESVRFFKEHLRPAEPPSERRLAKLLTDLDASAFKVRDSAARELTALGELATPALRQALKAKPTLEVERRIEAILKDVENQSLASDMLRSLRTIEVLEHSATPEAKRCLELLGKGASGAKQTTAATAALARLAKLPSK